MLQIIASLALINPINFLQNLLLKLNSPGHNLKRINLILQVLKLPLNDLERPFDDFRVRHGHEFALFVEFPEIGNRGPPFVAGPVLAQ